MTALALVPPSDVPAAAQGDPGEMVIAACEQAKTLLADALHAGAIERIAEIRSQAEAIRVYTTSRKLGKDAQLAAAEIVRRAERGIGVAIRRGQAGGQIRGPGHRQAARPGYTRVRNGRLADVAPEQPRPGPPSPSPTDFATGNELWGNNAGIYKMTDGVTDDQFEAAVTAARQEGDLSRVNVIRKARACADAAAEDQIPAATAEDQAPAAVDRTSVAAARRRDIIRDCAASGHTSRQISDITGIHVETVRKIAREQGITIPADKVTYQTHGHDSNRIVAEAVASLDGLAMGVGLADVRDIDPEQAGTWADAMNHSLHILRIFASRLMKAAS